MSSYDIRGMQASGMTDQQINDFIKQQDAKFYGPRGMGPRGMGPKVPVKPQVMPPVKPRPIRTATGTPIKPVKGRGLAGLKEPGLYEKFLKDSGVAEPTPNEVLLQKQASDQQKGIMGTGSQSAMMKKGGEAKKYTKGGKINLDACGVSTGGKSNKCPAW